jgi:transposase
MEHKTSNDTTLRLVREAVRAVFAESGDLVMDAARMTAIVVQEHAKALMAAVQPIKPVKPQTDWEIKRDILLEFFPEMIKSGATYSEAAQALKEHDIPCIFAGEKWHGGTIKRALSMCGLPALKTEAEVKRKDWGESEWKPRLSQERIDRILALSKSGMSDTRIANEVSVSRKTISKYVRKLTGRKTFSLAEASLRGNAGASIPQEKIDRILALSKTGMSAREIARKVGVWDQTVGRHLRKHKASTQEVAQPSLGFTDVINAGVAETLTPDANEVDKVLASIRKADSASVLFNRLGNN